MPFLRYLPVLFGILAHGGLSAREQGSVVVINESSFAIVQLFISPRERFLWGEDRLGWDILESGGRVRIRDVPCGQYDVRLVDEDGDACVVYGVPICGKRTEWVIRDADLLACQWLSFE